jgi:alpha-L-rhamnosidase
MATKDRAMADRLSQNLLATLYDHKAHLFITNTFDPIRNHAQDGNVEALLSGVLKGKQADEALTAMRKRLWTKFGPLTGESKSDPYVSRYISPYMSGWELIARLSAHDENGAKTLLTSLWGRMINQSPNSTMWEAMGVDGLPVSFKNGQVYNGRTSLSHGWSTAPVDALSGYVAGMRPVTPGWDQWLIEPQTLGLTFAQGRVGTVHGSLASRWIYKKGQGSFRITIEAPAGTSGTVAVPLLGGHRIISRDGKVVWKAGHAMNGSGGTSDGTYIRFPQDSGTHTYAWRS